MAGVSSISSFPSTGIISVTGLYFKDCYTTQTKRGSQSVSGVTLSPHLDFVFIPLLSSQHLTQIKR